MGWILFDSYATFYFHLLPGYHRHWEQSIWKNALDDAVKDVMTTKLPYTENFALKVIRKNLIEIDFNKTKWNISWIIRENLEES